jgi:hypothetical protein
MPIVRLPQGELRDEIRQAIYDQIRIGNADTVTGTRSFFSSVQGKPLSQSNLRQNNLLETAVSYRVMGLGFDAQNVDPLNAAVLPFIYDNSSIKVRIGEKVYWQGPLAFLTGRFHQRDAIALYGQATPTVNHKIHQRFGAQVGAAVQLSGKHVVDINPLQSFNAEMVTDADSILSTPTVASSTRIALTFSFKGLMRRPVQ